MIPARPRYVLLRSLVGFERLHFAFARSLRVWFSSFWGRRHGLVGFVEIPARSLRGFDCLLGILYY